MPSSKIYEDAYVFAFLSIAPNNEGHTLVIPKTHSENIFEMDDEVVSKIFITTKKLSVAIKKAVKADAINIAMNNGKEAGQVVFHSHVHIIPRYDKDGFVHWKGSEYKEGRAEIIKEQLKNAL